MRVGFAALAISILLINAVVAQSETISRLPPLPPVTDPILKQLFANIEAHGGKPLNIHIVQAFAPKLAKPRLDMAYALRFDLTISPAARELAILRTGQLLKSSYELDQHVPLAKACGITDRQIEKLDRWRDNSREFDEAQMAVLAYTDQIALNGGEVDDLVYNELSKHFTPQQIVELTITITNYYATAQLTKALRVRSENDGRSPASACK